MEAFDAEIFNPDPPRMVPDTSKIVSALQNTTLHPLDLLVRESVQNSLDAAIDENPAKDVRLDFSRGQFNAYEFSTLLGEECGGRLRNWMAQQEVSNQYIAIRDSNCCGLTGNPKDSTSNVYKLVYGFLDGKDAESATSGGSYGVGKTVFLHFGIGFVCYYSRTSVGQSMALFYCRNNQGNLIFEKAFMPFQLAWWGAKENESARAVCPVKDQSLILRVLDLFQLEPYKENETGTTVIIPFFDERVAQGEKSKFIPWLASVDDYLRFSVLKWYAPRFRSDLKTLAADDNIAFRDYGWARYLRCRFPDGRPLSVLATDSVSPAERKIFGLIRDLYDAALERTQLPGGAYRITVTHNNSPKNSLYFSSSTVGWFVIKKINLVEGEYANTRSVLDSLAPEGSIDDRKGFVLYCRKPGMIMSYDDSWGKVLSQAARLPGEFFFGVFVVNSNNIVYSNPEKNKTLCPIDQFFRETEKSDHYGWPLDSYSHGLRLINSIVTQLRSGVAKHFADHEEIRESKPKGDIARGLGVVFMAGRTGFGGTQLSPEGNGGIEEKKPRVSVSKVKKTTVQIGEPRFLINGDHIDVTVPFVISATKKDASITLRVLVETDGTPLSAETWDSDSGMYPIVAKNIKIYDKEQSARVPCEVVAETVSYDIDMSDACDEQVKGELTYTVSRNDMSTLVDRKEV